MRSTPGRCLPGQKKAGRMGGEKVTVQSLKIVKIDEGKQVILVQGAIPGSNESIVYVSKAVKKIASQAKKK
jgi:large subunit ribosomal protein L3